jgi:hypothetical protein
MPNDLTPSVWTKNWSPVVDLTSPAGEVLRQVVRLVPIGERITLFGSAPLQIALDKGFLSADLDCFGPAGLEGVVKAAGLDDRNRSLYVQVCSELNFRTSPQWKDRTRSLQIEGRTVILPHPIDILIAKVNRMEEKDFRAFELVRAKTGHPTEEEMIGELQMAVDLFRPGFDEEKGQDMRTTTRMLWQGFFGRDIDVTAEIIAPALARRREGYALDVARTDHMSALRSVGAVALPRADVPDVSTAPRTPQSDGPTASGGLPTR